MSPPDHVAPGNGSTAGSIGVTEGKKDDRGNLKMPPFKDKLTSEEIKSLIAVVKRFRK